MADVCLARLHATEGLAIRAADDLNLALLQIPFQAIDDFGVRFRDHGVSCRIEVDAGLDAGGVIRHGQRIRDGLSARRQSQLPPDACVAPMVGESHTEIWGICRCGSGHAKRRNRSRDRCERSVHQELAARRVVMITQLFHLFSETFLPQEEYRCEVPLEQQG